MRITIALGPFLPMPPGPAGAIERMWLDLGKVFVKQGASVCLLSRHDPSLQQAGVVDGCRYQAIRGETQSGWLPKDLMSDLRYAWRIIGKLPLSDVIVTNSFGLPVLLTHLRHRRRFGRLVVNVQRMPKHHMILYHRADCLAAVSSGVAAEIQRQTPNVRHLVEVVPNPIRIDTFHSKNRTMAQREEFRILYAGRIHREKGLTLLVDAVRHLARTRPTIRLELVGPVATARGGSGEGFADELLRRAAPCPTALLPPIYNRAELAQRMQAADVFVYPSVAERGETFGVAPLEAMATGLPTVVSALSCFRDFARPDENALIFNHRAADAVEQLASALIRLIDSPELRSRLGTAAATTATWFGNERIATRYLTLFSELTTRER